MFSSVPCFSVIPEAFGRLTVFILELVPKEPVGRRPVATFTVFYKWLVEGAGFVVTKQLTPLLLANRVLVSVVLTPVEASIFTFTCLATFDALLFFREKSCECRFRHGLINVGIMT